MSWTQLKGQIHCVELLNIFLLKCWIGKATVMLSTGEIVAVTVAACLFNCQMLDGWKPALNLRMTAELEQVEPGHGHVRDADRTPAVVHYESREALPVYSIGTA